MSDLLEAEVTRVNEIGISLPSRNSPDVRRDRRAHIMAIQWDEDQETWDSALSG